MTTALQPHIPYGYRMFSSDVPSNSLIDAYNAQTDKINEYIKAGKPVPENILNGRHNLFASAISRKD